MANNVREKVLETFSAKLKGNEAVTEKMVQDLRALFAGGHKVSADDVTAILATSPEGSEEAEQ